MNITIPCYAISNVTHSPGQRLSVALDMDLHQMLAALEAFLAEGISDQTWADWQAKINLEIYGVPA